MTAFCQGMGTGELADGRLRRARPHGVVIQGARAGRLGRDRRGERGPFAIQGWTGIVHAALGRGARRPPRGDRRRRGDGDDAAARGEEGVFAGISTGANVVGAHRLAERLGPEAVIVTIAVDTAFKYMSVEPFASLP